MYVCFIQDPVLHCPAAHLIHLVGSIVAWKVVYTRLCMYNVCKNTCIYIHVCINVYIYMHVYIYIYLYMYMYIYIIFYMYICI